MTEPRDIALKLILDFFKEKSTLDLPPVPFVRQLVLTYFRHLGEVDTYLNPLMKSPEKLPDPVRVILRLAVTEILYMKSPDYAVVSSAVDLTRKMGAPKLANLVNGVLRNFLRAIDNLKGLPAGINTPSWLYQSWVKDYGVEIADQICDAHMGTPPLDLQYKDGSTQRLYEYGKVDELEGYKEGAWWVQDRATSMAVPLCGDLKGKRVLDLCAAPGGKTAQLISRGADVTCVDVAEKRLNRLRENLARLKFKAEIIKADILIWKPETQFDVVLLDAPCSATGTIRRHPELPYLRSPAQMLELEALQTKMLLRAWQWVKPGGLLIYSTCSLQKHEGESRIRRFLEKTREMELVPVTMDENIYATSRGYVRTFPFDEQNEGGMDGFFIARMQRLPI